MPSGSSEGTQELRVRVTALNDALQQTLAQLAVLYGPQSREKIKLLRDHLIQKYKQSGIPPEREMDHAVIVWPAINAIELAFEDFV
jgi:hypothetical protein